jgi:putative transposase
VTEVMKKLCGLEVTSTEVSRAARMLDEHIAEWLSRPIGEVAYLLVEARYEKVRWGGRVVSCAVLIAVGVETSGRREILGVSVSLSEAEVHWREFFAGLQARGLHGVKMITSDDHAGLGAALKARFPGVPWQRCQFHLQRNAQARVPRQSMRSELAADLRAVFDASNMQEATRHLGLIVEKSIGPPCPILPTGSKKMSPSR